MTLENIKALSDSELAQVVAWGQQEQKARAESRKRETIAKIRKLARAIEVGIKIEGTRGRRSKHASSGSTVNGLLDNVVPEKR